MKVAFSRGFDGLIVKLPGNACKRTDDMIKKYGLAPGAAV
jgi:hypothetical protein